MRRNINTLNIEGRVYEHDLAIKTVQNQSSANYGKEFINGTVSIATDEAGLNVLTIHYTYEPEKNKNDTPNSKYTALKKIMEGKTWINDGKDAALTVRINPSLGLNDFYSQINNQLISSQRPEGGFIIIAPDLKPEGEARQKFTLDVIITGVTLIEADPEKHIDYDYAKINCAAFNFRNALLPITLVAKTPGAINYFMNLEASESNPIYTQVWGEIKNSTIKIERTIESAFGEPVVDVSERKQKEWIITGARPETYVFGEEDTITVEELTKAIADRNVYLEEVKTKAKEYYETKGNAVTANNNSTKPVTPTVTIPQGGFNF